MIYLDSAAVVKLAHQEQESEALRKWLGERADVPWVSSVLLEVEAFRAVARYAPTAAQRLQRVLDSVDLISLGLAIRLSAQAIQPATVRSLDAIHLATALSIRNQLAAFVTYDHRLAEAAQFVGLVAESPA